MQPEVVLTALTGHSPTDRLAAVRPVEPAIRCECKFWSWSNSQSADFVALRCNREKTNLWTKASTARAGSGRTTHQQFSHDLAQPLKKLTGVFFNLALCLEPKPAKSATNCAADRIGLKKLNEVELFEKSCDKAIGKLSLWEKPLRSILTGYMMMADSLTFGGRFGSKIERDQYKAERILARLSYLAPYLSNCSWKLLKNGQEAMETFETSDGPEIQEALMYAHFCEIMPQFRQQLGFKHQVQRLI
ncbi:hypothetical protein [Octadecabacter arcticus]|uniref:hypothetical protein n=1 Tax=Octadecabacter arcticus TaxID=53946 RepID=UPI0005C79B0C|nr:hypothetical protein [Octadecabacter arcticus]